MSVKRTVRRKIDYSLREIVHSVNKIVPVCLVFLFFVDVGQ